LLRATDRGDACVRQLCLAAIIVLVLTALLRPVFAAAADQTLLLEVHVNGYSTGKIGEFTLRAGALLSRRAELADLGFRVPDTLAAGADALIALSDLPGLKWRLDQAKGVLFVTAANRLLAPTVLQVGHRAAGGAVESGTGATLNYDVADQYVGGLNTGSGQFDLRVFSPWGVASTDALAFAGGGPGGPGANTAIRLTSVYTYSDPDGLLRYRLGDFISGSLGWTRSLRLGGVQGNSDFTLRPDLVTFPLPSVSGSVAVPSTVDVMANATRLFSAQVQPGPFEIPQLPVVTGANTISMAVTDALGRQVTVTLPFYASAALLAPGLQSFSAQVGEIRQNYGLVSNDYGAPAATATYRRGVSSDVTVEASAEGTRGTVAGGGGVVVNVADLAVVNAAVAGSKGSGGSGLELSAGMQRTSPVYSLGASATVASHTYRDVAAVNGDAFPRIQLNASAGVSLGQFGSIGVAYAAVDSDAVASPANTQGGALAQAQSATSLNAASLGGSVYLEPAQHAHVLSASYSVQIGAVSFFATGFHDFASKGTGVLAGLTMPLGGRSSVGVSGGAGTGGSYQQVQAQQSAVAIGDVGYQAFGILGTPNHEFGQVQYMSPWALLTGGVDHVGQQTTLRAEVQGAVSYVDGGVFPSNTINDSFAVVDTNGLADVRVLYENRDAGSTDSAGRLLVPDLRSFDINHIAIDPADIPSDSSIDTTTREVRPQDRSGVVVRFAVKVSHGALVRLVDEAGKPLPVGSTATLRATGAIVPVGYDGDAYVEDLATHNELAVEQPNGRRCRAAFDYRAVKGEIPTIGPLACKEQKP
jgi:outer membrane usher protein